MIPFVTSQKPGVHSYQPVPAPDEETLLASPENQDIRSSKRIFFLDPSFWLTAFAALSIAITIRNLLVFQLSFQEPYITYVEAFIRSPYNGLEKLLRNESSPSWPLSSTHYPDFIGATEGLYVHHALNNGSIVRLDSEVSVSMLPKLLFTYPFSLISFSAPLSYSTVFAITASSTAPSNWSFPVRLEMDTGIPHGDMGILERTPTSLCGV